jgi:hypothetical protein
MTPPALPDAIRTFLPEAPVTLVTPTRPDTDAIAAGLSVVARARSPIGPGRPAVTATPNGVPGGLTA